MNILLYSGGNQRDDLTYSEEDYIPLDDDGEIDNLLSDNRTSDEDDNRDKNMFELDPSTSDIRMNTFTSTNKFETWESESTKTQKGRLCRNNIMREKNVWQIMQKVMFMIYQQIFALFSASNTERYLQIHK